MPEIPLDRKANTSVRTYDSGLVVVRYHHTDIVDYDPATGHVKLDNGGWKTYSTKARMNQFASEWELPFRVYQEGGDWYVSLLVDNFTIPFDREVEFFIV